MSSVLERPEQNHAHMTRAAAPVFRSESVRGNNRGVPVRMGW